MQEQEKTIYLLQARGQRKRLNQKTEPIKSGVDNRGNKLTKKDGDEHEPTEA